MQIHVKGGIPDPETGCFSIEIAPLIMKQELVEDVGFEVILGQEFLFACGGMIDSFTRKLYYSPCLSTDGSTWPRVGAPVVMTTPQNAIQTTIANGPIGAVMLQVKRALGIGTSLAPPPMSLLHAVPKANRSERTYDPETRTFRVNGEVVRTDPIRPNNADTREKQVAFQKGSGGSDGSITPTAISAEGHPKSKNKDQSKATPALLHPGLPQGPVPDRPAFNDIQTREQARRRLDQQATELATAEARMRQQGNAEYIVAPIAVSYPLKALQASGRLLDGHKLDLSPNTVISEPLMTKLVDAVVTKILELSKSNPTPPVAVVTPQPSTTNSGPATTTVPPQAAVVPPTSTVINPPKSNPAPITVPDSAAATKSDSEDLSPTVPVRRMSTALPPPCPTATELWMKQMGDALPPKMDATKRASTARPGGRRNRKFKGTKVASYGLAGINPTAIATSVAAAMAALVPRASA